MNRTTSLIRLDQSLATDQFLYFFLRLRKGEVRRTVQTLKNRYPNENRAQLAQRLINSKVALSLVGGTFLHLPLLFPGIGQALKLLGVVGATSLLTRMHLYLILEIALLYDKDIDAKARIPEMMAVITATGLSAASPLLVRSFNLHPYFALPVGGLSAAATARLIGQGAIHFYSKPHKAVQPVAAEA